MIARLRKVTRNRGQFPSEQAALNVLYLAVRNLENSVPVGHFPVSIPGRGSTAAKSSHAVAPGRGCPG